MTEEVSWKGTAKFAYLNRHKEIVIYEAITHMPTVEEPWGNTIEKIKPGYYGCADPAKGCVGAVVDYNVDSFAIPFEGKRDFINLTVYKNGVKFFQDNEEKIPLDLYTFPPRCYYPRGGVPLTIPVTVLPRNQTDSPVLEKVEENETTYDLFSDSNVQSFNVGILMSFYFLYYIAMLAFLTEVGDAQIYYGCVMMILGGQWGYVIHTMYEDKRAAFFQGDSKKIETGEIGGGE
jgi:hypothetical protein